MAQHNDHRHPPPDLSALSVSGDRAPTDGELVTFCVADSGAADRAYPVLIRRYQRRTIAQLFALTHDLQAAEELAHETFVTAYLALCSLKDPQAFAAWLSGVAKNVYRKWMRDGKHRGRGHAGQSGEFASASASAFALDVGPADPDTDMRAVDERTRKASLYADMYRILDGLPEPYREVLLTRYFEELSCQEIADRLDRPLNTVTKQLSRGHALLAEALTSLRGHTTTLSLWLPQAEVAAAESAHAARGGRNGNGRQPAKPGGAHPQANAARDGTREKGRQTRPATTTARAKGGAV